MYMRIVWGKIIPGKWDEFEAAFKASMAAREDVTGLVNHWLTRDQNDENAGYSITLWNSGRSGTVNGGRTGWLLSSRSTSTNSRLRTEVRYTLH
jgi:heme-degrading monooxygenase HmoA